MWKGMLIRLIFSVLTIVMVATLNLTEAKAGHPAITLKTQENESINPLTGENSEKPYSPKQTCGTCHDYDAVTKGYHFQQGWDVIKDDFSSEKPYVLSDGMLGKW